MHRRDVLASLLAVPTIARLSRLELQPTDWLVLECATHISPAEARQIQERLTATFPGHKAIVLGPGMTLKVLEGR